MVSTADSDSAGFGSNPDIPTYKVTNWCQVVRKYKPTLREEPYILILGYAV